jgi:outer membrane protein insertion porin family
VSGIKLSGNLLVPDDQLRKLVQLKPGDVYSRALMTDTTKAISDRLGNDGYAFANVNAAPELDKDKHQVAFTIYVDPGRRVYVRNINISGNTRTRDEVIRRELRQMEGAWYDGNSINNSRNRVDRLGYFEDVTVETPQVAGTTDQVDLNVKVKEKPTGAISVGAGFSSAEKVSLSGSITQDNLFGSGKTVSLGVNTSKINTLYSLSYTNPYYTVDGISAGFDLYHRTINTSSLSSVAFYRTNSTGAGVRLGIPISDTDYLNMGLAVDTTSLGVNTSCADGTSPVVGTGCDDGSVVSPQVYQDYVAKNGTHYNSLVPTIGWSRNTIDSRLYPTKGAISRVGLELAIPPGVLQYYKATASNQSYWPLSKTFTLATNVDVGYAGALGNKDYPFFKNFYAGGIGSVRGYDTSSLGPVINDPVYGAQRIGGTKRVIGSAELLFPAPGMGLDKSVRLGTFLDGGQVWASDQKISVADLRYSTGVSLTWSSPLGPLKFSIAKALNSKPGDNLQIFQFTMGQVF